MKRVKKNKWRLPAALVLAAAFGLGVAISSANAQDKEANPDVKTVVKEQTIEVIDGKLVIRDQDGNEHTVDLGDHDMRGEWLIVLDAFEAADDEAPADDEKTTGDDKKKTQVKSKWKAVLLDSDGKKQIVELEGLSAAVPHVFEFHNEEQGPLPFSFGRGQESPLSVVGGKYMIGIDTGAVEGALAAHLKLGEGEGLIVNQVFDDTPAAKAGLRQYDVLLKVDGKELKSQEQLIEKIQAAGSEEKALELTVIRAGDGLLIEVTPAERESVELDLELGENDNRRAEILRLWSEELAKPDGTFQLRFEDFGPGLMEGQLDRETIEKLRVHMETLRKKAAEAAGNHLHDAMRAAQEELQEEIDQLRSEVEQLRRELKRDRDGDR